MEASPPQIPLLALAEYLTADIQRRHELVRQCVGTNDAAALRYGRARDAFRKSLAKGPPYPDHLLSEAECLERRVPGGDWDRSDLAFSTMGLRHIANVVSQIRLGDRPPRTRRGWPKLAVAGVEISIAPDALVLKEKSGVTRVGGLKVRWNQRPMDKEEGDYASTLLRVSIKGLLKRPEFSADPGLCQIVDAFSEQIFQAPRAYAQRMGRIEKACNEFRLYWMDGLEQGMQEAERTADEPHLGYLTQGGLH